MSDYNNISSVLLGYSMTFNYRVLYCILYHNIELLTRLPHASHICASLTHFSSSLGGFCERDRLTETVRNMHRHTRARYASLMLPNIL